MVKDALEASPRSTKKLFENEQVRVLEIEIKPGDKEPLHMHKWRGVMIVTSPAKLRYYDENDEVEFEAAQSGAEWREPSGAHSVENIDSKPFKAYRVELKK
jgi:hypothetical protein